MKNCLKCGKDFQEKYKYNRICPKCTTENKHHQIEIGTKTRSGYNVNAAGTYQTRHKEF